MRAQAGAALGVTGIRPIGAFEPASGGVRLRVRLTPKARREGIDGLVQDAAGAWHLKASVTAPPEEGKANRALIALLARALKLPPSSIELLSGACSRTKVFSLAGDPEGLVRRLNQCIGRTDG
jgi:hypothetical protein